MQRFTGVPDPCEPPVAPGVVVTMDREDEETCAARVLERAEELGGLPRGQVRREVLLPPDGLRDLGGAPAGDRYMSLLKILNM